ncbi:MAG: transposase [Selenomonadaceae bacterium]|nr:transposase [Selenomonadaceae bacterium]
MEKQKSKSNRRIRYDNAFKQGAICMIVDQHMPIKEVSKELGVSTDSLRTWLKNAGLDPNSANKNNSHAVIIK